ncbi:hypothetical protein GQ607_017504 [Colletotrichum asianum]|uniref:Uncharacterized protein n=1 Tax=Colletotrichum asianum TaxID=702518 RepID=A0A8H3VWL9_9PEZI|nr:hypothetical protein GQ607_017504 [Colletotrichum asianum]
MSTASWQGLVTWLKACPEFSPSYFVVDASELPAQYISPQIRPSSPFFLGVTEPKPENGAPTASLIYKGCKSRSLGYGDSFMIKEDNADGASLSYAWPPNRAFPRLPYSLDQRSRRNSTYVDEAIKRVDSDFTENDPAFTSTSDKQRRVKLPLHAKGGNYSIRKTQQIQSHEKVSAYETQRPGEHSPKETAGPERIREETLASPELSRQSHVRDCSKLQIPPATSSGTHSHTDLGEATTSEALRGCGPRDKNPCDKRDYNRDEYQNISSDEDVGSVNTREGYNLDKEDHVEEDQDDYNSDDEGSFQLRRGQKR